MRHLLAFALLLIAMPVAAKSRFTFAGVEFAPADQRVAMAEHYLGRVAASGTPLAQVEAAMAHADAPCRHRSDVDGAILCRYSRTIANSASDMHLGDITWTVRLYPSADGRVARASVLREVRGL